MVMRSCTILACKGTAASIVLLGWDSTPHGAGGFVTCTELGHPRSNLPRYGTAMNLRLREERRTKLCGEDEAQPLGLRGQLARTVAG